jgi:CRP-like cAMP-binding protein
MLSRMPMSVDEKVDALHRVPLFAEVDPEPLRGLGERATEVEFPPNHYIVVQGQVGSGMFLILSGSVRVLRGSDEIARLGAGEVFGEMSVIDQQPRMASVVTHEPTVCLALAAWDLLEVIQRDPDLALALLRTLAARFRAATGRHHH